MPSAELQVPSVGRARWLVELMRVRVGESADWIVEACDEEGHLGVPADLGHGSSVSQAERAAPTRDRPLVLAGRCGNRREVLAVNDAAHVFGVGPGMSAAEVQALLPNLATFDAEPQEDEAGLGRLAAWALSRYSPVVAADPPDGLAIDATGAVHLHGGEAAMLNNIVAKLAKRSIAARVAMVSTLGSAQGLDVEMLNAPNGVGIDGTCSCQQRVEAGPAEAPPRSG